MAVRSALPIQLQVIQQTSEIGRIREFHRRIVRPADTPRLVLNDPKRLRQRWSNKAPLSRVHAATATDKYYRKALARDFKMNAVLAESKVF